MEFKNTKPTASDFFRKYSDLVREAEEADSDKTVDKDIKKLTKDQEADDKKEKDKKEKKSLKEGAATTKWEKMMGVTPRQLQEKYEGFAAVEKSVAKNPKVRDPGAVAASIGRKKYGKAKFQKMASAGKKDESADCSLDEAEQVDEKWDKNVKLNPAKKGTMPKSKAKVDSELSNLKKSGPHKKGSAEYTKEKELNFAKRAKSGWGK